MRPSAREREQQPHGVLRSGDHVGLRRVGDHDPALGRRGDIDIVDPHPGASDCPQSRGLGDQLGVELGRRTDQDAVVAADPFGELLPRPVDAELDVKMVAQQLDAGLPDLLSNEHTGMRRIAGRPGLRQGVDSAHSRSSTQSMHAVNACTSAGSVAGNIPMRS
jgi:hypothetical protein